MSESALIGCLLEQPELAAELGAVWFDDTRCELACQTIQAMCASGAEVNLLTVSKQLEIPNPRVFLLHCVEQCVSVHNFPIWRDELRHESRKRTLEAAANQFVAKLASSNGNLPQLVSEFEALLCDDFTSNPVVTGKEAATALIDALERRKETQCETSGIATGYPDIDAITDGLQRGEMTVVGARPSIGKTALALNFVEKICLERRVPTLILSLEMSAVALLRRLLSSVKRIPMGTLRSGRYPESDHPGMVAFMTEVARAPLYIQESLDGMTAAEVAMLVRRMKRKHGVELVILDYLQKLNPEHRHEKRTYEVAEGSKRLKAVAHQNQVALIAIAQLNRESERDKGRLPRASDLADSGQIERDADNIMLLHRNRSENEYEAKLIVVKQRDGETGIVKLYFNGRYCRFESIEPTPLPYKDT